MASTNKCFICGANMDAPMIYGQKQGPVSFAARVLSQIGLVVVCSEICASDPRFSLKRIRHSVD